MCWSSEASIGIASVGFAAAGYAAYKKDLPALWISLFYFALMELLQAYTYRVINDCGHIGNQIATLLGYLHIAFQPFFGNLIAFCFVPDRVRQKNQIWVYSFCFIASIVMLLQLYPYPGVERCVAGTHLHLCGSQLCSFSGSWHVAWSVPYVAYDVLSVPIGGLFYALAMFGLPLLYGSWRWVVYHFCLGPALAFMTTSVPNERAAIWCLFSVAFLLVMVTPALRQFLHVKKWIFWKAP